MSVSVKADALTTFVCLRADPDYRTMLRRESHAAEKFVKLWLAVCGNLFPCVFRHVF